MFCAPFEAGFLEVLAFGACQGCYFRGTRFSLMTIVLGGVREAPLKGPFFTLPMALKRDRIERVYLSTGPNKSPKP